MRCAKLAERGLALDLQPGPAVSVAAALRSDELARVPGTRGSTRGPHTITLARVLRRGRHRTRPHLKVERAGVQRLRRRKRTPVRVSVVARYPDGHTLVATRSVMILR